MLDPVWTKPVKEYDRALDPLAMNRVTDRLLDDLLLGITTVTSRARYYSFYLWAIEKIREENLAATFTEFKRAFYDFERLFMLSCIAHEEHYKVDGDHKDVNGSVKGRRIWKERGSKNIPLNFSYFGHRLGGYGQYYRGPMRDLELITKSDDDLFEKPTNVGKKIVTAFDSIANHTGILNLYAKDGASRDVIVNIGKQLCVCRLKAHMKERDMLRDLFFGFSPTTENSLSKRRRCDSLCLMLHLSSQMHNSGIKMTDQNFLDSCFFEQTSDIKNVYNIEIPSLLADISKYWKILRAHDYLAFCCEALLTCFLSLLYENLGGATLDDFLARVKGTDAMDKFCKLTHLREWDGTTVLAAPLKEIMDKIADVQGIKQYFDRLPDSSIKFDYNVKINSSFSEFHANKLLEESVANDEIKPEGVYSSWPSLMLCLYMRFRWMREQGESHWIWLTRNTGGDQSPARFVEELTGKIAHSDFTLTSFIDWFVAEHVVKWAMRVYRDKANSSVHSVPKSFFHPEPGDYFIADREYIARHRNIRFGSAITILADLGLLVISESGMELKKDGEEMLRRVGVVK